MKYEGFEGIEYGDDVGETTYIRDSDSTDSRCGSIVRLAFPFSKRASAKSIVFTVAKSV